ncbi:hypothetical protein ACSAGD_10615 [Paramicrobacterium sp. CJ85]|uniref:hypothetical protein n=1 Tax=Paramicrobacterium sp. CJ85 TaxID=3445355 RepID=UPI003F5DA4E5
MSTNDESIDLDEAIKDFEDMIAGKPDAGYVLTNGDVLTLLKRLREAEARIERVVRLRDRMEQQRDDIDESVRLSTMIRDLNAALTEGDK